MIRGLRSVALSISLLASLQAKAELTPENKAAASADALRSLKELGTPPAKVTPRITKAGTYILWGDLFDTGRKHAIVEANELTVISEYTKGQWRITDVWDYWPCWYVGKDKTEKEFYHMTPPKRPFKLKQLDGEGPPELLIATTHSGYAVEYVVGRWSNSKQKLINIPIPIMSTGSEPTYDGKHLRTENFPPRVGNETLTQWYRWTNEEPVLTARRNVCDTDPKGEYCWEIWTIISPLGQKEHFKVFGDIISRGELSEDGMNLINESPYARISFHWKETEEPILNTDSAEELYIFERLTGLPPEAYGKEVNGNSIAAAQQLRSDFTVEVTGTEEGIKRFK